MLLYGVETLRENQTICINRRTTRKLTPLPARHRGWLPPRSTVAIQLTATCKSRYSSVASATPICILFATSGANSWLRTTRLFPVTILLVVCPYSDHLLLS